MEKFKNKKVIVSIILIAVIIFGVIGIRVHAKANLEAYQTYCTKNCTLTKVSNEQLDKTISDREAEAKASIEKSIEQIKNTKEYLSKQKLNETEQNTLSGIKLDEEYKSDNEYTVDQLITLETNYKDTVKKLNDVKDTYRSRDFTSKIVSNNKAINKTKSSLKKYDLNAAESKTQKAIDDKLTYDSAKIYSVKELENLNKIYTQAKSDYETLLSDTIKRTTAEKEKAALSANTNYGTDYGNVMPSDEELAAASASNTSNTTNKTKTTSKSNGASNSNDVCYDSQGRFNSACITNDNMEDNGNSSGEGRVCPYQSESAAISAAEKQLETNGYVGYGTYPCAQGTWEIGWF